MSAWVRMLGSSVGSKFIMGLTGLLLFLFVVAHLSGNLLLFAGRDAMNAYAKTLHDLGAGLWVARLGLLGVFAAHIVTAIKLNARNKAARPVAYDNKAHLRSTFASRYMVQTGLVILAFVVFHLLHFTIGAVGSDHHVSAMSADGLDRPDVYGMVIKGFSNPSLAVTYVIAMVLLGLHLIHGLSSAFQSFGIVRPRYREMVRMAGIGLTLIVVLGNIMIPLSVLTGGVKDDGTGLTAPVVTEGPK